jgi:hypothetical protein
MAAALAGRTGNQHGVPFLQVEREKQDLMRGAAARLPDGAVSATNLDHVITNANAVALMSMD